MSLGTDLACELTGDAVDLCDLAADMHEDTNGRRVYLFAIFRRLTTRRGLLWYDPSYGIDVRDYLLDVATDDQIRQEVSNEALKDERTRSAAVTVARTRGRLGDSLTIVLTLSATDGRTYPMTLAIDSVTGARLLAQGPV